MYINPLRALSLVVLVTPSISCNILPDALGTGVSLAQASPSTVVPGMYSATGRGIEFSPLSPTYPAASYIWQAILSLNGLVTAVNRAANFDTARALSQEDKEVLFHLSEAIRIAQATKADMEFFIARVEIAMKRWVAPFYFTGYRTKTPRSAQSTIGYKLTYLTWVDVLNVIVRNPEVHRRHAYSFILRKLEEISFLGRIANASLESLFAGIDPIEMECSGVFHNHTVADIPHELFTKLRVTVHSARAEYSALQMHIDALVEFFEEVRFRPIPLATTGTEMVLELLEDLRNRVRGERF